MLGGVPAGRWKSVTVAVKIIEHHSGPGTSSKAVNPVKIGQETLLATVAAHPNVVSNHQMACPADAQLVCDQLGPLTASCWELF